MKIIAVDIGGTKISFGLVEDGKLKKILKVSTEAEKGPRYIIKKNIIKNINLMMEKGVRGIGVGCPGPLDYKTGVIFNPPNLPKWKNIELKKILERRFKVPVKLDNDANVFTLGERRAVNMVGITLGSGVGSGLIINNKLYHGNVFASELGHMILKADGSEGSDGIKGSFENYCSGPSIEKRYFEKTKEKRGMKEIAEMKDKESKEVIDEAAHYLAIALANIKNIFDPNLVVLGGSLSKVDYMINKAIKEMEKIPYKSKMKVEIAASEHSALIGCFRLFSD